MTATTNRSVDNQAPGLVLSILRYWRSTALIMLAAVVGALVLSSLLPERYVAAARIDLTDPRRDTVFPETPSLPADLEIYTDSQAPLLGSAAVVNGAQELLGGGERSWDVSSEAVGPGQIQVRVTAPTAEGARLAADAVIQAYGSRNTRLAAATAEDEIGAIDRQRVSLQEEVSDAAAAVADSPDDPVLAAELDALIDALAALNVRVNEVRVNADSFGDGIEFVDPPETPASPTEPKPLRNAAVAGLLSFLVAGGVAWLRADRHRAASESGAPGQVLGSPLLGTVPELPRGQELAALLSGASLAGEAYQFVTASLQYTFRWGVLLVSSAADREGKTTSAASMAAAAARDGTRVLLVDGEVRRAVLTELLHGTPQGQGLVDLAHGQIDAASAIRLISLGDDAVLPFLPAGSASDSIGSLFRSERMGVAMRALRDAYDLVIVDCPSLLAVADVASLAAHADGIVLVVRRETPLGLLQDVRSRLLLLPAPLVGYVFNRAEPSDSHLSPGAGRGRGGRRPRMSRGSRAVRMGATDAALPEERGAGGNGSRVAPSAAEPGMEQA